MNHYATVTMTDGSKHSPVGIWIGGHTPGLRLYEVQRGRVKLLAAAPGLRIVRFGDVTRNEDGQKVRLPEVFEGMMPVGVQSIEYKATCACGSPLKSFVAPNTWET